MVLLRKSKLDIRSRNIRGQATQYSIMVNLIAYVIPEDGIQHTEHSVAASVGTLDIGKGTLYITESSVLWLNTHGQGLQLEYRQICLHAISRDLQAFPKEHLLCHYEGKLSDMGNSESTGDQDGDAEDDSSESDITEIRFAPDNKESLDAMFKALAMCQTLHPDSDCQLSEDGDFEDADEDGDEMAGGDVIYNSEEGFQHLTEEGRATMERLNQMLLAGQHQRDSGAGDADIVNRTDQMHITNGHHSNGDSQMDADQFVDADDDIQ
ncbi:hypothetical protein RRG08_044873 [Elysia crispata]|uniref:Methylosome subunit pICln n=1 Tax=Elysia crispata TaxID=231223 RepID=A0AAE0XEH6_9GAST|nr:hypothetical protein RRG08_044873 [Elysia crispata]